MSQLANATGTPVASKANTAAMRDVGTSEEVLDAIVKSLTSDKAEDIVQIDLRGRSEIADYMVICSGRSTRQVSSLAEKLTDHIKQTFGRISKIEGKSQGDWVLLDTGDVVVHIFRPEVREFYQLEKMWLPAGSKDADL
nr:ribosome silencing factor [Litoreibacter roseus]